VHGGSHWAPFYTDYGVALQKRFFDYFLKGERNGWDKQPRVQLQVRHPGEKFVLRHENEWPLARTQWTRFHLDPKGMRLSDAAAAKGVIAYDATGEGVTFSTPPLEKETEITGPSALKLFVSSSTADADIFAVSRVFDPEGRKSCSRARSTRARPSDRAGCAHRRESSTRHAPCLTAPSTLTTRSSRSNRARSASSTSRSGRPASSCRRGFASRSRSAERTTSTERSRVPVEYEEPHARLRTLHHDDETDRPPAIFGGKVTLHFGPGRPSSMLLPVIPPK